MGIKNPLFAVPVKYGLFAGLIAIVMFCVLYFLDLNPFVESRILDIVLIPIFLFFAIREFRDYKNQKVLHYWQGMTVGVVTYVLMAAISAFFILFFVELLAPDALTDYVDDRIALMVDSKQEIVSQLGQDTYDESIEKLKSTSAYTLALDDLMKKSIIGLMLTIMISIILRRQPK